MRKITIEIKTENAAFDTLEPLYEITRILNDLVTRLKNEEIPDILFDINGNKVGTVKVID